MHRSIKDGRAISLGATALIVIALIIIVGFGVYFGSTFNPANTSAKTTTSSGSSTRLTTYTTVTRTTLSFGGSTYLTTTGEYSGCIPPVQCYLTTVTTEINQNTTSYSNHVTAVNTFFASPCFPSVGGFEFKIVADSGGVPVKADNMSAVDMLGCNGESQIIYLNEFSSMDGGWVTPVFPSQATVGGTLNITVTYEGYTYNFTGDYPPVGTDCVTLHVPSGSVSSSTVMNGSGSYCS
ncbi:MAG: hypothetical protein JRN20_11065 [Nitrososphaerota archaeon]|nr:hypothetical protein [Nitrososphaerota archaeon]